VYGHPSVSKQCIVLLNLVSLLSDYCVHFSGFPCDLRDVYTRMLEWFVNLVRGFHVSLSESFKRDIL
jgi:hypothetical protein